MKIPNLPLRFTITNRQVRFAKNLFEKYEKWFFIAFLSIVSVVNFIVYYINGLGLSYNDARSHLDIGRRVVEGLKPGLAQLGSVWLPLPHLLMVPTIWNDFMWHTGLAGAIQSMSAFVLTGLLIYLFLKKLHVNLLGRIIGVLVFVANINILYMQSTAMTELLLIATMTAGVYYLFLWQQDDKMIYFILSAFWVMLATMNRYDGWFLFGISLILIAIVMFKNKGFKAAEGSVLFYATLAGFGIVMWFLWNLLIFKDPLYFALGPYSAHAQQAQLADAGVLQTKKNILLSLKTYYYALAYNTGLFTLILGAIGALLLFFDKTIKPATKIILSALLTPFIFNVLALYLGFSVLFVQGISGDTWFNVRYGLMMAPSIAIFVGYLIHKSGKFNILLIGLLLFTGVFTFANRDAVTIDDATVGSSQKNVTEVSGWLKKNAADKPGFILISAASHDAIIFSSGLPMSKFIHEGTGAYWDNGTRFPDRWARWIVMRTNDVNDSTFRLVSKSKAYQIGYYKLVKHFPFADIYEIKPQYVSRLNTKPVLGKQR